MDRWGNLNMQQKAQLLGIYASKGYTDLASIINHYNSYQDGGRLTFNEWKSQMQSKYPDIEMDNAKAGYDYVRYFNDNYDDAIRQLDELKHFPDTYKLPNHKTFSNESMYSRSPMIGGSWINDSTFSPSIINRQQYPEIYKEDKPYTEKEIYGNEYQLGGKLGHITLYGQWQYPHQVTTIPSNNITMKGVDYPVIGISDTGDTKYMLPNMDYLFDGNYVTEYPISYQKGGQLKRVRRNDSPTQTVSEKLEDKTARRIQRFNADKINHSYDIPYIPEKEIVVPGVGRVSTNALDSIAKYSVMAGIPLEEGLGLAAQETAFGANPYYNYGSNSEANRALGNSSYFRNYGVIPANYLVRDWHYFDLTDEQRATTPPLLDAFRYWKAGDYNKGDANHTSDVKSKGKQVIQTAPIQEWMSTSSYVKNKTSKRKK